MSRQLPRPFRARFFRCSLLGSHCRAKCSSSADSAMLASSGESTPPTQQRTFAHVTLRVGGVVVAAAVGWFPDGDAVADGDLLGSDEDVLDDGAQDALAVLGGGGGGAAAELGEEALEVAGEPEVGVAVGGLGVEGGDLVLQSGLAGAEGGHPRAEFVDGDELLGERGDHRVY